jgi:AcrR family transcriptional regulator
MSMLMNLRDRQRDQTRALLLEAAAALVAERGPDAATTRAIAAAAGVASGTVFAHFPDKTALLEALLHDHIEAALDDALAGLPEHDVVDQLVHVAGVLWAAYDRRPALARALLAETLFLADPERPLARQLQRFQAWVAERLADDGEPDAMLVFSAFFSHYFGLLVAGLRGELPAEARPMLLRALLVRLLRPADATGSHTAPKEAG